MKPIDWAIAAVVIFIAVYFAVMASDKAREDREKREIQQALLLQLQQVPPPSPTI